MFIDEPTEGGWAFRQGRSRLHCTLQVMTKRYVSAPPGINSIGGGEPVRGRVVRATRCLPFLEWYRDVECRCATSGLRRFCYLAYSQGPERLQSPPPGSCPSHVSCIGQSDRSRPHALYYCFCASATPKYCPPLTATTYANVSIGFFRPRNGQVGRPPRTAGMHATALLHRPAESVHERSPAKLTAVRSAANQPVASVTEIFQANPPHILAVVAVHRYLTNAKTIVEP